MINILSWDKLFMRERLFLLRGIYPIILHMYFESSAICQHRVENPNDLWLSGRGPVIDYLWIYIDIHTYIVCGCTFWAYRNLLGIQA